MKKECDLTMGRLFRDAPLKLKGTETIGKREMKITNNKKSDFLKNIDDKKKYEEYINTTCMRCGKKITALERRTSLLCKKCDEELERKVKKE